MGWSAGIPSVTSERPAAPPAPGRVGAEGRPSAWVPATGRPGLVGEYDRGTVLLYLFSSTSYLVLFLVLVVLSAFDQLGSAGRSLPQLLDLRNIVLGLGWLGMGSGGLGLWLLPTLSGVAVRPQGLVRGHLVLGNLLLVLFVIADLALGDSSGLANLLLLLVALSYLLLAVPLLLAIGLALGDWRAGV
jgi:hypothetical protein